MINVDKQKLNQIWNLVVQQLMSTIDNPTIYNECVATTKVLELNDNRLYIIAKSLFAKDILNNDHKYEIEELVSAQFNTEINVIFILKEEAKLTKLTVERNINTSSNTNVCEGLDKQYTFDNFIVGDFNKSAYNAAISVSNNIGKAFNPLFIYGGTGLGKSHLLHALGNTYHRSHPNKAIRYIETETFCRDVFSAISKGGQAVEQLKDRYCSYDLLLIDDVQYLSDKEKTNEIFFNIFNNLIRNNKHIVMTSDKMPDELDGLQERMVSRFASGLSIRITQPDIEILQIIVEDRIKSNADTFNFTNEAIALIVHFFNKDLRKLLGMLNRIIFYAIQNLDPYAVITEQVVNDVLSNEFGNQYTKESFSINPEMIIDAVCKIYGAKPDVIKSKSRLKEVTTVRHITMYVLRERLKLSYSEIGSLFSGRDHSSVMSGINKVKLLIKKDKDLKQAIDSIIVKI